MADTDTEAKPNKAAIIRKSVEGAIGELSDRPSAAIISAMRNAASMAINAFETEHYLVNDDQ